jgi:hypothetical protein
MPRRKIDFSGFDALIADVEALQTRGYQKLGNWSLEQCCDHLSAMMIASLEGFQKVKLPFLVHLAKPFGGLIRKRMLKTRSIPAGFKGPDAFLPGPAPDPAAIEKFVALCRRVETCEKFFASPLLGKMSAEEWRQVHLIHGAHHLSFLVPNE